MTALLLDQYTIPYRPSLLVYDYERGFAKSVSRSGSIRYDHKYFKRYRDYEGSPLCDALNRCRVQLVQRFSRMPLDIGIGAGTFLKTFGAGYGYDVNPLGVAWLHAHGIWVDPYSSIPSCVDAVTMWDVIEHVANPYRLLDKIGGQWLFLSLPIFADLKDVASSKHHKPGEHLWYFTSRGLRRFMDEAGFALIEHNWMESELGRDSIETYVFRRHIIRPHR